MVSYHYLPCLAFSVVLRIPGLHAPGWQRTYLPAALPAPPPGYRTVRATTITDGSRTLVGISAPAERTPPCVLYSTATTALTRLAALLLYPSCSPFSATHGWDISSRSCFLLHLADFTTTYRRLLLGPSRCRCLPSARTNNNYLLSCLSTCLDNTMIIHAASNILQSSFSHLCSSALQPLLAVRTYHLLDSGLLHPLYYCSQPAS